MNHTSPEIEPVAPAQQRAAIETAITARLGQNWQRDWLIVHNASDLVRLNRGKTNLDFQADLLGQVAVIEREANPVQISGYLVAWMVLGASLFVALAIASLTGII
jgi:hypothetical protein